MSWLDWAVDDPAPGNCGYSFLNVPCELPDPSLRRGQVVHSVEGWFTYTNPSAVMADRGNSWGVTIMRSGKVWRHRPRPTFVNWHAGGPAQNIGTDGIEMEGKDQPWTSEQRASLLRVLRETRAWFDWSTYTMAGSTDRTQEGIRQALLAHGYGSLWEHRWVDYTSCPSGRDDWPWLMLALLLPAKEEDDMPLDEASKQYHQGLARQIIRAIATGKFEDALRDGDPNYQRAERDLGDIEKAIRELGPVVIYVVPGMRQNVAFGPYRVLMSPEWLGVLMKGPHTVVTLTNEELNEIPVFPGEVIGGNGGPAGALSDADVKRIAVAVADLQYERQKE